jgi:hypothetical protein
MPTLPEQFADLEPFAADWAVASEPERYAKRLASTIDEMQAFYDALMPRAEAAIEYCNQFPLDAMPDDAVNLMHLLYSLITVSFAVELWHQPRVPDTGAAMIDCLLEPAP